MTVSSLAAPVPDSVERKILQRRLSAYGRIVAAFVASYLLVFNWINVLNPAYQWHEWLLNGSNVLHLFAALVMAFVWLASRTTPRSIRVLQVLDAVGLWGAGLAFTAAVWVADPAGSRNYAMQLELANLMVARSVLVPSSGQRTMALCAALVPFATFAQWQFDVRRGAPDVDLIRHAAEAFVSCSIGVGIATIASQVIFGLRAKVQQAYTVGQYTLIEKLGEGGMGVVYRASHAMLKRSTAVKLLPPEKSDARARERFEQEVQQTSKLTHPNTVAIYDYGRTRDGVFYFAMEYLDGLNLEELVRRYGPQPPSRVVHILRQVCASLAEAHAVGLVHRDVKPANLLLCERGGRADVVKVVDFGLVRGFVGRPEGGAAETGAVGTPLFMSPEAILSPEKVEPRSDLYGVGTVAYYLLTGTPVFNADNVEDVLVLHLADPPEPPSGRLGRPIPEALDALVLSCLAKDPAGRPASALALREALGSCPGVGPWNQAEALGWWIRHREQRAPEGTGPALRPEVTRTIQMDVEWRGR